MRWILAAILFIFAASGVCRAQDIVLSGRVTDLATGEPLAGAQVVVNGTANGCIADFDGRYSLVCKPGDKVTVWFVGYRTEEYYVSNLSVKNFYLDRVEDVLSGDVFWSFLRHSVYAAPVMPHNGGNFKPGLTVSYFYNLTPLPRFLYRWAPVRYLFTSSSLGFTAGKPAWDEKAVFYPSLNKKQRLISFTRSALELYGGVGYYFYMGSGVKVRGGNVMWNAGLNLGYVPFTRSLGVEFSAGYNYFAGNRRLNHITLLRVSLYRGWKTKRFENPMKGQGRFI